MGMAVRFLIRICKAIPLSGFSAVFLGSAAGEDSKAGIILPG